MTERAPQSRVGPTIRPFEPGDLPALQSIRRAAFAPVFRSFCDIVGEDIARIAFAQADAEQAKLLDDICQAQSDHHLFVVSLGEPIVGFVSFTIDPAKRIGEIGLNAVHPDHAGRGIGTWMYEQVLARMKERGMALATVGAGATRATKLPGARTRRPASARDSRQSTSTG